MSRIVYGNPSKDLEDIAKQNNLIIGGCSPSTIEFYCKSCKVSWSSDLGFDEDV